MRHMPMAVSIWIRAISKKKSKERYKDTPGPTNTPYTRTPIFRETELKRSHSAMDADADSRCTRRLAHYNRNLRARPIHPVPRRPSWDPLSHFHLVPAFNHARSGLVTLDSEPVSLSTDHHTRPVPHSLSPRSSHHCQWQRWNFIWYLWQSSSNQLYVAR